MVCCAEQRHELCRHMELQRNHLTSLSLSLLIYKVRWLNWKFSKFFSSSKRLLHSPGQLVPFGFSRASVILSVALPSEESVTGHTRCSPLNLYNRLCMGPPANQSYLRSWSLKLPSCV